jgi:hypothetical protein
MSRGSKRARRVMWIEPFEKGKDKPERPGRAANEYDAWGLGE